MLVTGVGATLAWISGRALTVTFLKQHYYYVNNPERYDFTSWFIPSDGLTISTLRPYGVVVGLNVEEAAVSESVVAEGSVLLWTPCGP